MVHICALWRNFLKAAVLHYFPSRVWLDAAVLGCCLFPVHFGHFTTSTELAFGSDSRACYAAFLRSLTETFRGLNSCICALWRNFLKVGVLHFLICGDGFCSGGTVLWGALGVLNI